MTDLPVPKFSVGQTVWYADITRKDERWPCPDCKDTKTWKVETPAGQTYEVPCQRCGHGYVYHRHDEVVSLSYTVYSANPRSFVIKDIEISTRGHFGSGPEVRYGGRSEGGLYATEEEARAASQAKADTLNTKEQATPEFLAAKNIGNLVIDEAMADQFKNGLWNAWYAYRALVEAVEGWINTKDGEERESLSKRELEDMRADLRWQVEYREKEHRPLDQLVEAARLACEGDASRLHRAYMALPEQLRREPKPAPVEELAF